MTDRDIMTKLVHAGERLPLPDGVPVSTPIYASATFTYNSMQEIDQVFSGEKQGFIYTPLREPDDRAHSKRRARSRRRRDCVCVRTGMAAVHAALIACDLKADRRSCFAGSLRRDDRSAEQRAREFRVKTVRSISATRRVREKARELRPQV
jgi:cystathionine beta-lyase/cystathionine gamma-synthase